MQAQKLSGKPANILDLFTYDLSTFFYVDDYEIVDTIEKDGVLMVEYEKTLPWTELHLFDKVIFRVFTEKGNINSGSHANLWLNAAPENAKLAPFEQLVNALVEIYGNDVNHKAGLTPAERSTFDTKNIERQWTIGIGKKIYTIVLRKAQSESISLSILFFNHLTSLIH